MRRHFEAEYVFYIEKNMLQAQRLFDKAIQLADLHQDDALIIDLSTKKKKLFSIG